ncbi:MAG: ankyrin repeat domain-containing protein [Pseudomonadota bacterium]|jgi:hypothetical protein|nr:ankyrin repeat domain-containing protein [Pseudomonadota bacterium]QKK05837.1 MAG: ankyrin repeat domain-containing protein [Pseudomonadota bacterium]
MAEKKPSIWNIRRYLPEEKDVNTVDKQGLTKIFQAAQKGKGSEMRTLIEKGADIDFQFQRVSESAYSLTNPLGTRPEFAEGSTPLHVAVIHGNIDAMKVLMDNGAKLSERDLDGCTPLDRALEKYIKLDDEKTMSSPEEKQTRAVKKRDMEHTRYKVISKLLAKNGAEAHVFTMPEKLTAEVVKDDDIALFTEDARAERKRRFPRIRIDF